ncbi:hypothetical protein L0B53_18590 (plasmid) [Vibrio sp. SS-MA-C1-2]|uniref:hypothetical protein n=1 Tax=Vibrio sp. SS-MA-C1-2 TaxID=2908646 RepID=UPI001F3E1065|nr:hypothetical protein [Vibrio sp. SS-MA-C1-2]UJF20332.1 hypothetical protein L0B53_18590 [Vibrio sp. SS-MA-C1-2]
MNVVDRKKSVVCIETNGERHYSVHAINGPQLIPIDAIVSLADDMSCDANLLIISGRVAMGKTSLVTALAMKNREMVLIPSDKDVLRYEGDCNALWERLDFHLGITYIIDEYPLMPNLVKRKAQSFLARGGKLIVVAHQLAEIEKDLIEAGSVLNCPQHLNLLTRHERDAEIIIKYFGCGL